MYRRLSKDASGINAGNDKFVAGVAERKNRLGEELQVIGRGDRKFGK
jgi:hypothetical protein